MGELWPRLSVTLRDTEQERQRDRDAGAEAGAEPRWK